MYKELEEIANKIRNNLECEDRNRFILSKEHGTPVLYAVLAEIGYLSKKKLKEGNM